MTAPKLTIPCTECGGKGNKPRPESTDPKERYLAAFPMVCDRCSGSGKMPAPPPGS